MTKTKPKVVSAEINGIKFTPLKDVEYKNDYVKIYAELATTGDYNGSNWLDVYRYLVRKDLFFIVYFVLGIPSSNKEFVVDACRTVETGPRTETLDLWGREHYKSTIITTAEVIQKVLVNPNERIGIFSHTRAAAKSFLRGIKLTFENNEFLHDLFPDVLYRKPHSQASKWSEDDGLILKRSTSARESTIEACGLIEGMPTGKHYTHRVYDDIVTEDLIRSPDMLARVEDAFFMSENLGTEDGSLRVVGTPYHHEDMLAHLRILKKEDGSDAFNIRLMPTLEGGVWNGKPVLLSEKRVAKLKLKPQMFNTQHLLNPTPAGTEKLNPEYLQYIEEELIPKNVYKFMIVDQAGDNKDNTGDAWAIMVLGVEPKRDELGASRVFLLDASIKPLTESQGIETIARMYINAGIVQKLGIEKVGLSTTEIHVSAALRARGRHISVENKNLVLLKPAGRNKDQRIEAALSWPLNNSKLFVSSAVPEDARDRLKTEMRKFPYWHKDGLDAFSYLYDIIKDYSFMAPKEKMRLVKAINGRTRILDRVSGY